MNRFLRLALGIVVVFFFQSMTALRADDCYGTYYDPGSQGCCGSQVYDLPTQGCCSGQVYYFGVSDCCSDGSLVGLGSCPSSQPTCNGATY